MTTTSDHAGNRSPAPSLRADPNGEADQCHLGLCASSPDPTFTVGSAVVSGTAPRPTRMFIVGPVRSCPPTGAHPGPELTLRHLIISDLHFHTVTGGSAHGVSCLTAYTGHTTEATRVLSGHGDGVLPLKGPARPQLGGTEIVGRPASTASATRAAVSRSQMCAASRVCTGCHHKAS